MGWRRIPRFALTTLTSRVRAHTRARENIEEFGLGATGGALEVLPACLPTADQRSYKWRRTRISAVIGLFSRSGAVALGFGCHLQLDPLHSAGADVNYCGRFCGCLA